MLAAILLMILLHVIPLLAVSTAPSLAFRAGHERRDLYANAGLALPHRLAL